MEEKQNSILMYQTEDGLTKIEVTLQEENIWLTQAQMAELFQSSRTNIVEHIKHIYEENELEEKSTCQYFRQVRTEGFRQVARTIPYYNLDMIISVGYRVKSIRATQFRIWANKVLKEYLIKGFALNDEKLANANNTLYFKELLQRIRAIRASEKMFYLQLLEIFATSIDYNPNSTIAKDFFSRTQNKLHWAVHGHTAAELIYERANAELPYMGLQTFKGTSPTKQDARIAKNYLKEKEIALLDRLVSAYLDLAEIKAMRQEQMTMHDWQKALDTFLTMSDMDILQHAGKVSALEAKNKADREFNKYQNMQEQQLTQTEKDLLAYLKKNKE